MGAQSLSLNLDDDLGAAPEGGAKFQERSVEATATSALDAYLRDRDAERDAHVRTVMNGRREDDYLRQTLPDGRY